MTSSTGMEMLCSLSPSYRMPLEDLARDCGLNNAKALACVRQAASMHGVSIRSELGRGGQYLYIEPKFVDRHERACSAYWLEKYGE